MMIKAILGLGLLAILCVAFTGCNLWKSHSLEKVKPTRVVYITAPTVLQQDTNGVQYVVTSTLDLNGHTISGYFNDGTVVLAAPYAKVHNGTIKDAYIGVLMRNGLGGDIKNLAGMTRVEAWKYSEDHFVPNAFHDMVVKDVTFKGAISKAVYVQTFVHNSIIDHILVHKAEAMAVYLDAGSHANTISNSVINHTGRGLKLLPFLRREAISVDASYNNRILGNVFNYCKGKACIALYVNCGENNVPRPYDSNDNWIENNKFYDSKVGVYVSSRKNVRGGYYHTCGDYTYPEVVKRTHIIGNTFHNVVDEVIDRGEGTVVE